MSEAFESIRKGLEEAIDFAKGGCPQAVIHDMSPLDVRAVRARIGLSQTEFASAFGISVSTLRHWERGDRTPRGPALVLLNVVAREPEMVMRVLAG